MPALNTAALSAVFPIGAATGEARPLRTGTAWSTWRVDTSEGGFFVKRIGSTESQTELARGMEFELAAFTSGLPLPEPVQPNEPAFALAAPVPEVGLVRVHEWVDLEPLGTTDVSMWLGASIARMHQVAPLARAQPSPLWYGPKADHWEGWLIDGERLGLPWAKELRQNLPLLLRLYRDIETTHAAFAGFALTHPDIEPWNVGLSSRGAILVDWDFAGPDSGPLVLAHAALNFAQGNGSLDPDRLRRTLRGYRDAGGPPLPRGPGLLSRRLGMMFSRLGERLRVSLGHIESPDKVQATVTAAARLRDLPKFAEGLAQLESLFPRG